MTHNDVWLTILTSLSFFDKSQRKLNDWNFAMGKGRGIPIEIRIQIARYFEEHGFDKKSKLAAREMYKELSKSDKFISR